MDIFNSLKHTFYENPLLSTDLDKYSNNICGDLSLGTIIFTDFRINILLFCPFLIILLKHEANYGHFNMSIYISVLLDTHAHGDLSLVTMFFIILD